MKRFVLSFLLWGPGLAWAQLQDSHFYKVDDSEISSDFHLDSFWKTHIEGSVLRDRKQLAQMMKIKMHGRLDVELNSWLKMEFEPYLVFTEGSVQSHRFSDRENGMIQMRQGFFRLIPVEGLSLQAGAINQDFLRAPLLMDDKPALSLLAGYLHIRKNYEWQLVAQQSMLSFENYFRRYGEISHLPFLTSLFAYGEWLPSHLYSFKGHLTGYYFSPLPGVIANESRLYGNSIAGGAKTSSRFLYRYHGLNYDISSQWRLGPSIYMSVGYSGLFNIGAPKGKNLGESFYTVLDMDYFRSFKLYSRWEYFYNESDTAPAYFNTPVYGHNDRKGFLTELKAFFPKGNFEVGLRYVWSRPIQESLFSSQPLAADGSVMMFVSSRYRSI